MFLCWLFAFSMHKSGQIMYLWIWQVFFLRSFFFLPTIIGVNLQNEWCKSEVRVNSFQNGNQWINTDLYNDHFHLFWIALILQVSLKTNKF